MKQSSQLKKELKHINHYESIQSLRDGFIDISNTLVQLVSTFNILDETVYLQYCPMVNNDEGAYWLSKEEEIFNPYFGEKMLKCGETKRILK